MAVSDELRNADERYRLILESQNDLIYILNLKLEIEYINEPVFKRILGYNLADLKKNEVLFAVHPEDKEKALKAIKKGIMKGEGSVDLRIRDKKGDYHSHEVTGKLFTDYDGVQKALIISRDVTEKRNTEENYRIITENANDLVGILNKDFVIQFINEQSCYNSLGYKIDEVIGRNILDFVHPLDKERGHKGLIKGKKKKEGIIEIRAKHKNGNYIWFEVKGKVYFDDNNEPKGIIVCRDISSRKQFETKLKVSEEKYRLVSENANDLVLMLNGKFKIEYVNEKALENILGYSKEDILNKMAIWFAHPDDQERILNEFMKIFDGKEVLTEGRVRHKNGNYIWTEFSGRLFSDDKNNPKFHVIARDVTERIIKRKDAEKSLIEEKNFIETALNSQRDTFFVFNPLSGEALIWNKAFGEVTGYTDEEIKALKAPSSYYSEEDLKKASKAAEEVLIKGKTIVEMELITKEGQKVPYEYTGTPIQDAAGNTLIVSIGRNISERKVAERKLRESEEKFRVITEQSFMSIMVIQDGLIKYVNDRASQIYRYSREEMENWDPYEFIKVIHPKHKEFVLNQVKKKQVGEQDVIPQHRYRIIRKDNKIRWVENFSKTINYQGKPADLITTIDITDNIEAEMRLRESEERYRIIAENSNSVVWSTDMKLNLTFISSNCPKVAGYTVEEAKSMKMGDRMTLDSLKKLKKIFLEELKIERRKDKDVKRSRTIQIEQKHKSGEIIPVEITFTFLRDENDKAIGLIGVSQNISERKKAEQKLKESEEKFRGISDQSLMSISVIQDGLVKYVNDRASRINGYPPEEIYSWGPYEFIKLVHPDDKEFVLNQVEKKQVGDEDVVPQHRYRLIRKDKKILWIENYSKTINYGGKPADLITSIDITDKIEAEQKLRESEEKYRKLFDNAPFSIVLFNTGGKILDCNNQTYSITGYSKDELIGNNFKTFNFYVDMTSAKLDERQEQVESGRIPKPREILLYKKDGTQFWARSYIEFVNMQGETYIQAIIHDITEQKQARFNLHQSEQRLQERVKELNFLFGLSEIAEKSDLTTNDLLFSTVNLIPPAMQFPDLVRAQILFNGNEFNSTNFKHSNWKFVSDIEINKKKLEIHVYHMEDKKFLPEEENLIKDLGKRLKVILEKKKSEQEKLIAQKELAKSYERLIEQEKIINNSPGVLFLWKNSEGWPVEYLSENITQFGYTKEDFYSGKVKYEQIIHPKDRQRVVEEVYYHSNKGANEFVQEYRITTKSGEIKWLDDRTWIRRDSEGNITHFQGIVLDITNRKSTEDALKLSERNYKKAYDMANFYKDLFTHDMNNILQIINSSAEIITFQLGDSEKSLFIENLTNMIKSQIDRGSKLISDVRTLTSLDEEEISTDRIDILRFLNESIRFVRKAYPDRKLSINKIDLDKKYYILGNELLQDVFDNILINAVKYNENTIVDMDIKIIQRIIDKKNYIQIEFSDNGIGVTDGRKDLIFRPGHREIKGSKGMGIGLSLVSRIMEIFKGKIWVEDRVKGDYTEGSRFIILLPEITQ